GRGLDAAGVGAGVRCVATRSRLPSRTGRVRGDAIARLARTRVDRVDEFAEIERRDLDEVGGARPRVGADVIAAALRLERGTVGVAAGCVCSRGTRTAVGVHRARIARMYARRAG